MSRRSADRIQGYRAPKGVLIVTGQLNGGFRRQFLVDTGATFTVITQKLAQEMGLDKVSPQRKMSVASAHPETKNGSGVQSVALPSHGQSYALDS